MKCPECGDEFSPGTVTQKFCSTNCGQRYRRRNGVHYPSVSFSCAQCGRAVVTEEHRTRRGARPDMRIRFCCQACEKKYFKHRREQDKLDSPNRINFSSIDRYIRYEKRTNEEWG